MNTNQAVYTIPFKWSTAVTIITISTLAVTLGVIFFTIYVKLKTFEIIPVLIFSSIILILIGVFLYMPVKVQVQEDSISIKRVMGEHKIVFNDINTIEPISKSDIANAIRLFGSGGLFGYYGYFRNAKIGKFVMYATNTDSLIKIKSTKGVVVISCQHREEVVGYIRSAISNNLRS
jgi:hypothetical protein